MTSVLSVTPDTLHLERFQDLGLVVSILLDFAVKARYGVPHLLEVRVTGER